MKGYPVLILFLFAGTILSAQVSFKAVPDKTTAKVGERIQLSYIISTGQNVEIEQVVFPGFSGFQMLGRSSRESFSMTNGRTTRQIMETVVLVPQRQGRLTVSPASIEVNGNRIQSNSVTFQITKADPKRNIQGNQLVFMDVELSKTKVYPNENLTAEVTLYAKSLDALRRRSEIEVPGMSDFQVTQLSKNQERDFEQVYINNQYYISEKIAVYQLTPRKEGELEIPSFSLRVAVPLDFFEEKIIPVSSAAKSVTVEEFPSNAPLDFNGAVGNFRFETNLDNNNVNVNESVKYDIELIGEGNLSGITLPKINFPDELESYPSKTRNAFQSSLNGEKGKIVNSYVLVPQYGGNFTIPSVTFTFFNPKTERYQTITTQENSVSVSGDTKEMAATENNAEKDTASGNRISETLDLIPDLPKEISGIFRKNENKTDVADTNESGTPWWYFLGIIPLIAAGYMLFARKKKKNEVREKDPNHVQQVFDYKPMIRNDLSELRRSAVNNDRPEFLNKSQKLLNNIIIFYAQEQKQFDVIQARKILADKKSDGFAHRWEQRYNEIQMMSYGVVKDDSELMEQYSSMESLIKELLK